MSPILLGPAAPPGNVILMTEAQERQAERHSGLLRPKSQPAIVTRLPAPSDPAKQVRWPSLTMGQRPPVSHEVTGAGEEGRLAEPWSSLPYSLPHVCVYLGSGSDTGRYRQNAYGNTVDAIET